MLGSLYAVVMGPTTLAEAQPAVSAATFDLIFFIIGLGIIFVFEAVKRKAEHKKLSPWLPMMLWRATTRTTSEVGN